MKTAVQDATRELDRVAHPGLSVSPHPGILQQPYGRPVRSSNTMRERFSARADLHVGRRIFPFASDRRD